PIDGSTHALTPERSIEIQHALGADVIMALDEFLSPPASHGDTERSLERTLRWAQRSQVAHARGPGGQALFGIVQGGPYGDLRERAARETVALGFDGYAVGGMAVGEPKPVMCELTALVTSRLPSAQPRYLMGVGKPEDLVESVARGIDMFDCVLPTRNARNGGALPGAGAAATQAGASRARPRSAGRRVRLLHLPEFLARVPPAPVHGRRAARVPIAVAAQRVVLQRPHAGDARGDRDGRVRAIPRSVFRP